MKQDQIKNSIAGRKAMQTELDFYSSVNAQFGSGNLKKVVNPPFSEPRYANYFGKKSAEKKSLTIPISSFPIACKCPKLFAHGIMPDGTYKLNFYKSPVVFSVGSLLDKYARRFVASLHLNRTSLQSTLRAELKVELEELFQPDKLIEEPYISFEWVNKQVSPYLYAFDNFCDIFKNAQLAELSEAKTNLEFAVQGVKFHGKVDLLLKSKNKGKYILVDLKLKKFDDDLSSFKFQDHIQVFVYAHVLMKRGVDLDFVGYYYFMENMLILNSVSSKSTQTIKSIVEKLSYYITRTSSFVPRKCELCLICPLKSKCPIGRHLGPNDFKNPLV